MYRTVLLAVTALSVTVVAQQNSALPQVNFYSGNNCIDGYLGSLWLEGAQLAVGFQNSTAAAWVSAGPPGLCTGGAKFNGAMCAGTNGPCAVSVPVGECSTEFTHPFASWECNEG